MSTIPCNNCRRSKRRCSREEPCSLCKSQSVKCIYNESNPYKCRKTSKIAKIFDRADKLEVVLKKALKEDNLFNSFDISRVVEYWKSIKIEMTSYSESSLPIALAWNEISNSMQRIPNSGLALTKISSKKHLIFYSNSINSHLDRYQDYLILYNIYITYLHPQYPFINPQRILSLLELAQYDNPLLTSTLCRAQIFWFATNNCDISSLDDVELYKLAIRENMKKEENIDLEAIQININLALMEAHRFKVASLNKHLIAGIYKSHQLGLHDIQSVAMNEEYEEKECAWSLLTWLDFLAHVFLGQPRLINVNCSLNMGTYSSAIDYDKDKIFTSASSYVMKRYESCVKLSWDFSKSKREFHPEKTTESTILHFIEMLSRAQTFIDMGIDINLVKEQNNQGSTASLWRLAQFAKCCMYIIDICELLGRYYKTKAEIRKNYLKIQREYSIKLIETMFPQLVDSDATNIQHFELIDPIYPIAAFHACKILLEDSTAISKEYFGCSYKHCINSFKLFKCNWIMEMFFKRFENHPYLIQLNKELKIRKSYLSKLPSTYYFSPSPFDFYLQNTD
jgi:hypothetical protein